jgi:hypothetical protein
MNMKSFLSLSAVFCATALVAVATPVTPTYNTFGNLAGATFGGNGISTAATAIATANSGNDTITLGLTANPKFPTPPIGAPLANDGAGTFSTAPGTVSSGGNTYANWNFDFYVNVAGGGSLSGYVFKLFYGNNNSTLLSINNLTSAYGADMNSTTTIQNSFNLAFAFLGVPGFDPNAAGQYAFELQVQTAAGGPVLATDAIVVNVGSVPDATSTAGLLGLGLAGLGLVGFAKNRLQKA